MSIEGVWTGEMYGPYGWENGGVYVLREGLLLGGNNRHYSNGRYRLEGDAYEASVAVHYYGPPRAVFGEKKEEFEIQVTGTLKDGVIEATVVRPDRPEFAMQYRMTRRMDLPAEQAAE